MVPSIYVFQRANPPKCDWTLGGSLKRNHAIVFFSAGKDTVRKMNGCTLRDGVCVPVGLDNNHIVGSANGTSSFANTFSLLYTLRITKLPLTPVSQTSGLVSNEEEFINLFS